MSQRASRQAGSWAAVTCACRCSAVTSARIRRCWPYGAVWPAHPPALPFPRYHHRCSFVLPTMSSSQRRRAVLRSSCQLPLYRCVRRCDIWRSIGALKPARFPSQRLARTGDKSQTSQQRRGSCGEFRDKTCCEALMETDFTTVISCTLSLAR